jgi:UDP-N-acetylmuramoyl-tripeptide--D-alanyl-D-alanine ligase
METVFLSQLESATHGELAGVDVEELAVSRVSIDSRDILPGDVFWALKGDRHDGHRFASQALEAGAAMCVVERQQAQQIPGPRLIVENTLRALADFALWYRQQRESLVIGVTGSVGKTTTREMIHTVLLAEHSGAQSQRNFNNEIGLPLSLLNIKADDEFGVFEMGAARPGDIRELCEIARPEIGVLTKIGLAHLQSFGSLENIIQAKGELLDALPAHGFAVLGGDDEHVRQLAPRANCPTILVGERPGNQVRATEIENTGRTLRFVVDRKRYEVPVAGRHHLTAALCALAVAREIGMDASAIAGGLRRFVGQPGRCRVEQIGPWTVIDDTYNANPTSMQAACECLANWPARRRLLVVGDMLELGTSADQLHRELGDYAARSQIHLLAAYGSQAGNIVDGAGGGGMNLCRLADCSELETMFMVLDCWLEPEDVVLVKGSRDMRMERVVDWIRQRAVEKAKPTSARRIIRAVA